MSPEPTSNKVSIFPILLVNFVGTLGFSIILPFMVVLVLSMHGNALSYGFLGATYSFFQFIGAPILGNWSDKIGRKKILLLSELGTFIGWGIFLIALFVPAHLLNIHSEALKIFLATIPLFMLFIARAVDGITGGNISVAYAYLADITTKEDRKKNFGKMTASGNIGFIIGPGVAGLMGSTSLGNMLPVLVAMFISLLALYTIFFQLKDIKPQRASVKANIEGEDGKHTPQKKMKLLQIIKLPNVGYFLILYFLIYLAFNFFFASFPVYAIQKMKWNMFELGIFFSILSGVMVVVQGPVLSRISKIFSGTALVIVGSLLLAICFVMLCFGNIYIVYGGAILYAAGNGIMWPSFLALLSNASEDKYQGAVQGFATSMGSLASIIGLVAGAFLYNAFGEYTFLMAAAFMIIIIISCFKLGAIEKQSSQKPALS